jgi:maleylpyruvate isomerase
LKLNPQGLVPCLVVDSNVLTQSVAIIEYLEEVYPNPPLLPSRDPLSRAKVRSLTHMITSDIQPIQNLRVLQKIVYGCKS